MKDTIIQSFDTWTDAQGLKYKGRVKSIDNISLEGIARLRELILELAIRGKLVPQDTDDEPASELLKKIEKEKAKLVKEGKLRKEKPLPVITDDEKPFELPEGWEWCRLGQITNYGTSEKVEPGDVDENTWVLELEDVEKGTSKLLQKVRVADKPFQSSKNKFYQGDVIYGKLRPYLDKVLVADEDGVCTTEMIPFRGYMDISPEYLRMVMKSSYFITYASNSTHGMNLPRLGTDKARHALLPLTSQNEQHRIVAKVDELMALCDQLEAEQTAHLKTHQQLVKTLLQTLTEAEDAEALQAAWQRMSAHFDTLFCTEDSIDQLKQTILQLAIMGKLVPQNPADEPASELLKKVERENAKLIKAGKLKRRKVLPVIGEDELPFELPIGWKYVRLNEIGEWGSGSTPNRSNPSYYGGNIPWFKSGELVGDFIDTSEEFVTELALKESSLRYNDIGDVLIAMYGATIGKTSILKVRATTNQAVCACTPFECISNTYLLMLLKAYKTRFTGMGAGGAQPNISREKIINTIIALPPLAEQRRIVAKVEELMALCDKLSESIIKAKEIKVSLSQTIVENAVA